MNEIEFFGIYQESLIDGMKCIRCTEGSNEFDPSLVFDASFFVASLRFVFSKIAFCRVRRFVSLKIAFVHDGRVLEKSIRSIEWNRSDRSIFSFLCAWIDFDRSRFF